MPFIPDIEQQPIAAQQSFQDNLLGPLLSYLQKHSPWYRRLFANAGIDLPSIQSIKDLQKIPTTNKEDLQRNNKDFLCVAPRNIQEYTATSGTLGMPVSVALTASDLDRLAYNEYLSLQCMNGNTDDVYQLMLTLDRQFMAGMAYYNGLRRTGAAAVRTGPGLPAMQWDVIRQLNTTGLVGVPSFISKMIDFAEDHQIDLPQSTVTKILAIGESLRTESLESNALAKKITDRWHVKLYGTYASTEMQTAFTECSEGKGGHHHPELLIVELLDDDGLVVPEGERGEVTITTIGVEGMPLLRYRTGDICRAHYEPCACGRMTMRLGPVLGRKQQMIKFKGTTLYPPALFELLNALEQVKEYFIVVATNNEDQDELCVYIHTSSSAESCLAILKPTFQHKLRVVPTIIFCNAEEMQKMQFPPLSRKQLRFRDERKA